MAHRRAVVVVAVIALLSAACELQLIVPEGDPPLRYRDEVFDSVVTTTGLVYGQAPDENEVPVTLRLDLYQPADDPITTRPAIVWVHGGGFTGGNRSSAEIVDQAQVFARKGFVTVSISYRLSATGCSAANPTLACVNAIIDAKHDAQAAVRWLRANAVTYGIDGTRIAVGGSSAGAITALNVGFGPEDPGTSGNPGWPSDVRASISLSGAAFSMPDEGDAWALLFHTSGDPVVPFAWAQDTLDRARAAGVPSNMTVWDGPGHVPYGAHRTEILDQTTNFVYWALDLEHAAT